MSEIQRLLWHEIKNLRRVLYYYPLDVIDSLRGRRDPLTPPRWVVSVGGGDFKKLGELFVKELVDKAVLQPDHRMLDIGCGIGRVAAPLTSYLGDRGSYEGIDIQDKAIRWCQNNITTKFPNFRFQWMNIFNAHYNPGGTVRDVDFVFPYQDREFDVIYLNSVFTHMYPESIAHYLDEISRMLKPGGRCFATFFLLNRDSLASIKEQRSDISFSHFEDGWATKARLAPEEAIAVDERFVLDHIDKAGLVLVRPITYGSWAGIHETDAYQDEVLMTLA